MYAAFHGYLDIVTALVDISYANPHLQDSVSVFLCIFVPFIGNFWIFKHGRSALMLAALRGHVDIIKYLLGMAKAQVDLQDNVSRFKK